MSTISAVIITKNEEHNIEECLASVQWANEIVVVDAESTDGTVERAKRFTNRVIVRPWPGFGPQKNFGFQQANSEWILIVDADERVSVPLADELRTVLKRSSLGNLVAYRVPRRNYFYGRWVRYGGAHPDYQIRLIRKGLAHYNNVGVHENLIISGDIGTLQGWLDHYTERTIADHFRKFNLYTTLAAQEKGKTRTRVSWYHLTLNPLVVFLKTYIIKTGWKDGIRGLIFATFASMYTFVKYAKLWEARRPDQPF